MPLVPDAELVRRCLDGEEAAWVALTERYADLAFGVARSCGLSATEASDAVQQTFLRLLSHLKRLRKPESLLAWIVRTARTSAIAEIRKARSNRRWDRAAARAEVTEDPTPVDSLESMESRQKVRLAYSGLGERCRRLLDTLLLADTAASYDEIARELGLARGSIGSLRQRCLAELRDLLNQAGWFDDSA